MEVREIRLFSHFLSSSDARIVDGGSGGGDAMRVYYDFGGVFVRLVLWGLGFL